MNILKIPISDIKYACNCFVFNDKIKVFLRAPILSNGIYEIEEVFDYEKVQYVSWNRKELEIKYL